MTAKIVITTVVQEEEVMIPAAAQEKEFMLSAAAKVGVPSVTAQEDENISPMAVQEWFRCLVARYHNVASTNLL